ncbi:MAG: DNRLRE domain-containing protein, partial [Planctomycetes bacterium]|nr:DNRLRE domain-containing protein [Planctomycetota bacterium]
MKILMNTRKHVICLIVVLMSVCGTNAYQASAADGPTVVPFYATDDAHVKEANITAISGNTIDLELRLVGSNWGRVSYLKFDVSSLSGPVTGAVLKLYSVTQDGVVNAFEVADTSWEESSISWETRPATGDLIAGATAAPNSWFQIDVSSYITGEGTYSIALETPVNSLGELSSSEGANPPVLEVTVSPSTNYAPTFNNDIIV